MAAPHVGSLPAPRLEQGPLPQVHRHVPWKALAPIAVGIAIALAPVPAGLTFNAWMYFALFAAVVVGLVLEPIPASAIGLLGVVVAAVLRLPFKPEQLARAGFDAPAEALKWALAGFANSTVWLIFAAYMFALGYEKTGLGKRIALLLVKALGKRTLGLGYAITLADLVLAPFTPSNTARSGGTVYPVVSSIPPLYGSLPGPTSRRIGSYLMWTAFAATCVTSSMFLTALAPNLLAVELVRKTVKVDIGWTQFAVGFLPVGILLLAVLPLLVYVIHPPELKRSDEVTAWAAKELGAMGRISAREVEMAALVVAALACWIFGRRLIDATTVAIAVVGLMVVSGVVAWDDVVANKPAWNVLVWFATLVTMAEGLNRVGFVTWFANGAAKLLAGLPVTTVLVAFVVLFFAVHYLFASLTAHTTAVLPVILAAGAAVPGMPVAKLALLLCYGLGMMGVLTPYATGPGPVYYGSGYVSRADFWKLGLVFGAIFLAALVGVGVPWVLALD
jgi:L-tartrate/succinate antiporter